MIYSVSLRDCSSAGLEHLPSKQRVAGSSPVSLKTGEALFSGLRFFLYAEKTLLPCKKKRGAASVPHSHGVFMARTLYPFSLSRRKNSPFYVVRFKDATTGKYLSGLSTGKSDKDEAIRQALLMMQDPTTTPRRKNLAHGFQKKSKELVARKSRQCYGKYACKKKMSCWTRFSISQSPFE